MVKKILHINWNIWPQFRGGHVVHVHNLIKALEKRTITQGYLYSIEKRERTGLDYREYVKDNKSFFEILNSVNRPFETVPSLELEYQPVEKLVTKAIEKFCPDIIHIHHMIQIPIRVIETIKDSFRLPIIITIRDYWYLCPSYTLLNCDGKPCTINEYSDDCSSCFAKKNNLETNRADYHLWNSEFARRRASMVRTINKTDVITFVSDYLRQQYLTHGVSKEKTRVVHAGVPFRKVDYQVKEKPNSPLQIAFLGYASAIKGTYFFLQSLTQWNEAPIIVHFFGGLEDEDLFYDHARMLNNVRVVSHGPYDQSDIQNLLYEIDVGVVPSLWPDTAPQVIFDFFASGKPVIASRVGGIPEFVRHQHDGLLFEPGDHDDLLKCLTEVARNRSLLRRLKENVIFPKTSNQYAEEIYSLYLDLIQNRRPQPATKIELGGGGTPHKKGEEFLHIDHRNGAQVDILADMRQLPFKSNSVDRICCSNVEEHFDHEEVQTLFEEWHRALKVGGSLDVTVPALEDVVDLWRQTPFQKVSDAFCGSQKFEGGFHSCNGFNEVTLKHSLMQSGFKDFSFVKKYLRDDVPRLWVRALKKIKIALYPLGDDLIASSRIRMLRVYPRLVGKGYDVHLYGCTETSDLIILQKQFYSNGFNKGKPIILDLDDNYLEFGDKTQQFQQAARMAAAIVVSTGYLAAVAQEFNDNVYIIPTGLDTISDKYRHPKLNDHVSRVAWVGYPENIPSLKKVIPFIKKAGCSLRVITRDTQDVRTFLKKNANIVEFYEWNRHTVDRLLMECDLGIAPLLGDGWSQSKSAHKLFKYWSLGLPVICDLSPEHQLIEDEFGVECIAKGASGWEQLLKAPKHARMEQVLTAQRNLTRYNVDHIANLWDSVIREVMKNCRHRDDCKSVNVPFNFGDKCETCIRDNRMVTVLEENHEKQFPMRIIAFYLPQYHPIPENNLWWGEGFTEWTNVSKARPLFEGHYQPRIPSDLGFYDLRLSEVREAQADLAQRHGIYGFCYYHYWFGGKRLLNRPFDEVLSAGKPDFPFCLCWANERWTRAWDGRTGEILIDQDYSAEDDKRHIRWLSKAFRDKRYIRVNGKPLFLVYRANQLPNSLVTTQIWREEARKLGIGDLYLCRVESFPDEHSDPSASGFDAAVEFQPDWQEAGSQLRGSTYKNNAVFRYESIVERMLRKLPAEYKRFPCVSPGWDNSPRRKSGAHIFVDSTPDLYEKWLDSVIKDFKPFGPGEDFVFINAWNEWGEGNYLEPDAKFGRAYLQATERVVIKYSKALSIKGQEKEMGIAFREPHGIVTCRSEDTRPSEHSLEKNTGLQTDHWDSRSEGDTLPDGPFKNLQAKRIMELERSLQEIYDSRGWKLLLQYYRFRDSALWRKKMFLTQLRKRWKRQGQGTGANHFHKG